MFYKLHYFKKSEDICADDLKNEILIDTINLSLVSSLSSLRQFRLPFTGQYRAKYALLTMNNGDRYFIDEGSFADVSNAINQLFLT